MEERILQYLENQMTPEEERAFLHEMQQDEALQRETEETKRTLEGIRYAERNQLLNGLRDLEATLENPVITARPKNIRRFWPLGVAAAVAAMVLSWVFYWQTPEADPFVLYAGYYEGPYKTMPYLTVRSPQQAKTAEEQAFYAYHKGQYEEAANLLKDLENPEYPGFVQLALAMSYIETERHDQALPVLEKLAREKGDLEQQARWYLALTYLHENQLVEARANLQKLAETQSSYAAKAKEILNRTE